jgi:hypothetical protein
MDSGPPGLVRSGLASEMDGVSGGLGEQELLVAHLNGVQTTLCPHASTMRQEPVAHPSLAVLRRTVVSGRERQSLDRYGRCIAVLLSSAVALPLARRMHLGWKRRQGTRRYPWRVTDDVLTLEGLCQPDTVLVESGPRITPPAVGPGPAADPEVRMD